MGIPVVVCGSTNSYAEIQETLWLVARKMAKWKKAKKIRQKMDAIRDDRGEGGEDPGGGAKIRGAVADDELRRRGQRF